MFLYPTLLIAQALQWNPRRRLYYPKENMNLLVHLEIFCGYWLLFSDFLSSSGDAERVESLVGLLDCFPWVVGCRLSVLAPFRYT